MRIPGIVSAITGVAALLAAIFLYYFVGITWFVLDQRTLLGDADSACIEQSLHKAYLSSENCRPANGVDLTIFGNRLIVFANESEGDFTLTCKRDRGAMEFTFGYYTSYLSSDGGPAPTC